MDSCRDDSGSLTFAVRKAWLAMRSAIGEELKAFGLSSPQYATLMMARAQPGMSAADIAREVGCTRQSATEMLGGLEREGLIERRPHPTDRRTQQFHVTEAGAARYAQAHRAVIRREAELAAAFDAEQMKAVRHWLANVSEACR